VPQDSGVLALINHSYLYLILPNKFFQLNILIIISSLSVGGAEKQVVEDARLLSDNHKVYVLAFNEGPLSAQLGNKIELIIRQRKGYLKSILFLSGFIRKNNISLVHAHLYAPMVIAAFAGQLTSTPVIWNFHSHSFDNSFKAKMLHKGAARLKSVRKIVFPAAELDLYYAQQGYSFSRMKTLNAYNSGQEMPINHRNSEDIKQDKIHIGFVGRVIPLKRVEYLLELAIFLKEKSSISFVIDIVGNGSELESLQSKARLMQVEDYIIFHGFRENTKEYYQKFHIFAMPSREEVLSLALIDAGLAGIPVVAFNVGGNHEIVVHSSTGYLVDTKEDFLKHILTLMENRRVCEVIGKAASDFCIPRFSPKARLKFLENLYAQVVQNI
jgi:L-malate glycosyltransferase